MKKSLLLSLSVLMLGASLGVMVSDGLAATSAKPMELIFSSSLPPQSPAAKLLVKWMETIEQKSGERVKFVPYWGTSLLPAAEALKGVMTGVADVAPVSAGTQDYLPLSYNITYLPFMGYPSMKACMRIYGQLYSKFPAIRDEFAGVKRLASRAMPPAQIHTAKKAVRVPSDLKGMKIAIFGGGRLSQCIKSIGASPVEIPLPELNIAVSSGLAEGLIDHFPTVNVFGIMPSLPYHTVVSEGGMSMLLWSLVMNPKTFDKLPPDVQKIVEETSAWWAEESTISDIKEIERAMNKAKELNHTVTYLTDQEFKVWIDSAAETHQKWIADMQSKGKPAKAIYEEALRLIKEYHD
jgi:TRAP-type C4-dicarboxylate transport system substrate-binding protein